jgi:predicted DNA-binding transcriptional regulator YafY
MKRLLLKSEYLGRNTEHHESAIEPTPPEKVCERLSRPPMERMMRIHRAMAEKQYPNCNSLAREFEVCARTIKRDIEFMRDRLGLPIEYHTPRHGYHFTRPVPQFPSVVVNEAETFALLVAHKAIAQYRGTPFQRPLESAFRRLTGQLDQTMSFSLGGLDEVFSFRPFAPEDADLRVFETLTKALREHRALGFLYRNHGATESQQRRVHPYHCACIDSQWYLFAFDVERKAMRTFALARLREPRILDEQFVTVGKFDANQYLNGSLGAFKGEHDYEVVADFDTWAADIVRGRKWHWSQEITELPGGALRLRVRLNNIEEAERWLLGFGTHVTVMRPIALADRLRKTGEELAARYAQKLRVEN